MRQALAKGPLTGKALKETLETMRDYDPQGLTPKISFLPGDHRPNMSVFLYKIQNGKLTFLSTQTLERKAEWLGL